MLDPTPLAIGAWSGGRFMHFGAPLEDDELIELLRPDRGIPTLITADVYGCGEADKLCARAIEGLARDSYSLVGAVGHDFYNGERAGAKGFPRFTDPGLRGESEWKSYLRMATEKSLERCGVDRFDLLLLHNPDWLGYTSETVWEAMAELRASGLAGKIGIAPGPANGFTLDLVDCFNRFGELIDWAMIILNPLEPWPGDLVLSAAEQSGIKVMTRVVDYGGLFWDDVRPGHEFARYDHRGFRPKGWVEAGNKKLDQLRPIAENHDLTLMQLACQWNLAHPAVECVAPTLIQEVGGGKSIQTKRAELAQTPPTTRLSDEEIKTIRSIGDNTFTMALKGSDPEHTEGYLPDRWPLSPEFAEKYPTIAAKAFATLPTPTAS